LSSLLEGNAFIEKLYATNLGRISSFVMKLGIEKEGIKIIIAKAAPNMVFWMV